MRVTREEHVPVPLEEAWAAVAAFQRSGWIDGGAGAAYEGRATLDDIDDDEHVAGFHLDARERDGHGSASGTVTSRFAGENGGTRLTLDAELAIAGGGSQSMADAVLEEFARGLEQQLGADGRARVRRPRVALAAVLALALIVAWRWARR